MISFGIMQGRLTPSRNRGIQFFPFENWENEFEVGAELGLDEIEWIFDYDNHQDNPLWTTTGVQTVQNTITRTGVKVRSVCFDYFMRRPFYKADRNERAAIRKENLDFTKRVLDSMHRIGASLLEVPMVDDSSIKNSDEAARAIEFLHEVLELAAPMNIMIGCETDMPVGEFRSFLDAVGSNNIYANYDSGNSSGLGYDHAAEIRSLAEYIVNVHIKDRVLHGTTVALGTGNADFEKVFCSLKEVRYDKSILLQAARGEEGDEIGNIRKQLEFVKAYCKKYGME